MRGVGQPRLLVPGDLSPHHFSLRPSDARALRQADLIVWVGPELETFLAQLLPTTDAEVITLLDAEGMRVLGTAPPGGRHVDHAHATPGSRDGHLWLDPRNAIATVHELAQALSGIDPDHAERYRSNARQMAQRLTRLDVDLQRRLTSARGLPYVVFHDAYGYLEQRYGLRPVGIVSIDPERPTGARRVLEVREAIRESGAHCVFTEPQFPSRLVPVLIEDTDARSAVLDPLGTGIPPGPDAYFQLMDQLAGALLECLLEP
jgi:zinc transport system substrate-binding protein